MCLLLVLEVQSKCLDKTVSGTKFSISLIRGYQNCYRKDDRHKLTATNLSFFVADIRVSEPAEADPIKYTINLNWWKVR